MPVTIKCPCGTTFIVKPSRASSARYCSRDCMYQFRNLPPRSHGLAAHGPERYLYNTWLNIINRCLDPKHNQYKNYGERGISIYSDWVDSPVQFIEWIKKNLGERPVGYSIDRIDNDGNYTPGNLRWATSSQQSKNRRNSSGDLHPQSKLDKTTVEVIRVRYAAGDVSQAALAREYGVNQHTIWAVINNITWKE
jgi:hypothetical protein